MPYSSSPVQQKATTLDSTNTTTHAITLNSTPTIGNLLELRFIACGSSDISVSSISGGGGAGTWTFVLRKSQNTGIAAHEVWYVIVGSGPSTTITVTMSAMNSVNRQVYVTEWSGNKSSSPIDVSASDGNTNLTTISSGNISTTDPGDLVTAGYSYRFSDTTPLTGPSSGYTELTTPTSWRGRVAYKVETSTETTQSQWTITASGQNDVWAGITIGYLPATAAFISPEPLVFRQAVARSAVY